MRTRGRQVTNSKPGEFKRINRNEEATVQAAGAKEMGRRAVFLDRDGVINALVYHQDAGVIDAPFTRSQFRLLPRVPEAICLLNDLGLRVAIVSNQPGIAKGHLKPEMLEWFDRTMLTQIQSRGGAYRPDFLLFASSTGEGAFIALPLPLPQTRDRPARTSCGGAAGLAFKMLHGWGWHSGFIGRRAGRLSHDFHRQVEM